MSQIHTIVVRFAEGIVPRYSAATEFQGGQAVAVDFDGNRLQIAQDLEEALDHLVRWCAEYISEEKAAEAYAALAKARGES